MAPRGRRPDDVTMMRSWRHYDVTDTSGIAMAMKYYMTKRGEQVKIPIRNVEFLWIFSLSLPIDP